MQKTLSYGLKCKTLYLTHTEKNGMIKTVQQLTFTLKLKNKTDRHPTMATDDFLVVSS